MIINRIELPLSVQPRKLRLNWVEHDLQLPKDNKKSLKLLQTVKTK